VNDLDLPPEKAADVRKLIAAMTTAENNSAALKKK
jgi:hypothetical protein